MEVTIMSTNQNKKPNVDFYFARNKDGYMCSYDKLTHKCRGVIVSTGDNVEYIQQHRKEWIGQIDPKYE